MFTIFRGLAIFCLLIWPIAADPITMFSIPSGGPDNASPSWPQYATNAIASLSNGSGSIGDPSIDPTAYGTVSTFTPGDIISSTFPSWEGAASPSGAFADEFGNQLLFGLVILGNGNYFRLSNMFNTLSSSDPSDALGGNSGGFTNYGPSLIGIDYGNSGILGAPDNIVYDNGEDASLPVNELIYVGVGASFDASGEPGDSDQEKLDSVSAFINLNAPLSITNTYTLYDDDFTTVLGSVSSTVSEAPEPSAFYLLITLIAGCGLGKVMQTIRTKYRE